MSVAVAWVSAGLIYLASEAVAAVAFRPSYRYEGNFISDLGVPGGHSPLAWLMNLGFCVQGALFLLGALALSTRLVVGCAGANFVGNVLIAGFHSGPSPTAWVHAAGAVLAIVGGNAAIIAGSSIVGGWHRRVSVGLGGFGLLSFALFMIDLRTAILPLGVVERCSVYPITAWQLLTAAALLSRRAAPSPGGHIRQ